jgi:hypothetical protein
VLCRPDHRDDYRRWLHEGWGAQAISRVRNDPVRHDIRLGPGQAAHLAMGPFETSVASVFAEVHCSGDR